MSLVPYESSVRSRKLNREVSQALARTDARAVLDAQRIRNGYRLAEHTAIRAAGLNGLISSLSADNPGMEMTLRPLEAIVLHGAAQLITDYLL